MDHLRHAPPPRAFAALVRTSRRSICCARICPSWSFARRASAEDAVVGQQVCAARIRRRAARAALLAPSRRTWPPPRPPLLDKRHGARGRRHNANSAAERLVRRPRTIRPRTLLPQRPRADALPARGRRLDSLVYELLQYGAHEGVRPRPLQRRREATTTTRRSTSSRTPFDGYASMFLGDSSRSTARRTLHERRFCAARRPPLSMASCDGSTFVLIVGVRAARAVGRFRLQARLEVTWASRSASSSDLASAGAGEAGCDGALRRPWRMLCWSARRARNHHVSNRSVFERACNRYIVRGSR